MKTFSITTVSLVAMAGFAFAQGATKGSAAGGATAGAGATVKAGAGGATAGSAAGGAKAAGGTAGSAAGAAGAKAGSAAGAGAAVTPPAKMEMPKPPVEIADMAKQMKGAWRCTGTSIGPDMKTEVKFKGTMNTKSDLDGWWIRHVMNGTMGEGKASAKFKMESFATYDATNKKWRSVAVMNDGGLMLSTSDGVKEGKMMSTADTWGPWGQGQFRENMDMTDVKKVGVKMGGEMSMDKGKTWNKVYEMTCKK